MPVVLQLCGSEQHCCISLCYLGRTLFLSHYIVARCFKDAALSKYKFTCQLTADKNTVTEVNMCQKMLTRTPDLRKNQESRTRPSRPRQRTQSSRPKPWPRTRPSRPRPRTQSSMPMPWPRNRPSRPRTRSQSSRPMPWPRTRPSRPRTRTLGQGKDNQGPRLWTTCMVHAMDK